MAKYFPDEVLNRDASVEDVQRYIIEELRRISIAFEEIESIQLPVLNVEPPKPRNGMIVLADGTDFNPGSGAGFYGRSAGAWILLG